MVYVFIALFLYTIAILLGAIASRHLHVLVASGIMTLLSAVIPLCIAVPLFSKKMLIEQRYGVLIAICAGITIALFTMSINKSFTLNKVSFVTPVVFGGSIFLSSILGTLILKEEITSVEILGLAVLAMGLGIIIYARVTTV